MISSLTLLKGNTLFVWHVIGMSVAVFAFQPAALHSMLARRSFSDSEVRKTKVRDHKFLQLASASAIAGGFSAIYLNKPAGFPGKHFMSAHSLVGVVAMTLMSGNMIHAAYRQGQPLRPQLLWASRAHRVLGTLAFVSAFIATLLGLYNRTPVVDWTVSPIRFSLPDTWSKMDGWSMSTHGTGLTWAFIVIALFLLAMMLLPGEVPAGVKQNKDT